MKKSKKTKTIPPVSKGRIQTNRSRPRSSSKKKQQAGVPAGVFWGLGGVIILILGLKLAPLANSGSAGSKAINTKVAKTVAQEEESSKISDAKTAKAQPAVETAKLSADTEDVAEKNIAEDNETEPVVQKVGFAKPLVKQEEPVQRKAAAAPTSVSKKPMAPAKAVAEKKVSPMILDAEDQAELDKLQKVHQLDLTEDIRKRINHLSNKYHWFKSMRYQYPRTELERKWAERSGQIDHKNKILQSRRSTMFPRPLQILLEGVTDPKRRGYLMRVWQKPVSFAEKEMCRRASEQAKRERMNRIYNYKKEREKEVNRKILKDKYGYEYYLNDKGERVYID